MKSGVTEMASYDSCLIAAPKHRNVYLLVPNKPMIRYLAWVPTPDVLTKLDYITIHLNVGRCRIIAIAFARRLTVVSEPFPPFPDRNLAADNCNQA